MQDITENQISVSNEIESRLKYKCEKLADALIDDSGLSPFPFLMRTYMYVCASNMIMWLWSVINMCVCVLVIKDPRISILLSLISLICFIVTITVLYYPTLLQTCH